MILEPLKEFCSETNVHGIRFFVEKKRHWMERLWWIASLIISVALCVYAIQSIWIQWQDRPVILTFNDKITSIGKIPFPAVTICSTQKLTNDHPHSLDNFKNMIRIFDEFSNENYSNLSSNE